MTAKAKGWRYGRVSPLLEMGPALLFYQIPFVTFLFLSVLTAKMLRFVDRPGQVLMWDLDGSEKPLCTERPAVFLHPILSTQLLPAKAGRLFSA